MYSCSFQLYCTLGPWQIGSTVPQHHTTHGDVVRFRGEGPHAHPMHAHMRYNVRRAPHVDVPPTRFDERRGRLVAEDTATEGREPHGPCAHDLNKMTHSLTMRRVDPRVLKKASPSSRSWLFNGFNEFEMAAWHLPAPTADCSTPPLIASSTPLPRMCSARDASLRRISGVQRLKPLDGRQQPIVSERVELGTYCQGHSKSRCAYTDWQRAFWPSRGQRKLESFKLG